MLQTFIQVVSLQVRMFSSFRNKISGIFTNNKNQTILQRSESVKVQSKVKLLTQKQKNRRQTSTSKNKRNTNTNNNVIIGVTPRKITSKTTIINQNIYNNKTQYNNDGDDNNNDQIETLHKNRQHNNNRQYNRQQQNKKQAVSQIITNRNWLDFVSDIDHQQQYQQQQQQQDNQLLMPNQQQSKQLDNWNSVLMTNIDGEQNKIQNKQVQSEYRTMSDYNIVTNKNYYTYNNTNEQQIEHKQTNKIKTQQFINLPKYSQQHNNNNIKKTSNCIKCYNHQNSQKCISQCMVCGQQISSPKNTVLLSCAHRIHQQCYIKMKWRNTYTCNICQRRKFREKNLKRNL